MNDFLSRYLKNECNERDFDSAVNLMLTPEKKDELEQRMRKHWAETSNEGSVPDFDSVLYRIHYLINKSENSGEANRICMKEALKYQHVWYGKELLKQKVFLINLR